MALRQTTVVHDRLVAAHPELAANGAVEIVTIRTAGDRVQDRLLAEIGGKGPVRQGDRGRVDRRTY
jgi:hydroxymethylbilane synthase